MSGKEELMRYVEAKICEQEKGIEENMKVQNYLIGLQKELKIISYEEFIRKLVQEDDEEEMSSTCTTIIKLIKVVLKECCDSKAKSEYMIVFLKDMFSDLNEAVKASRIYERLKG